MRLFQIVRPSTSQLETKLDKTHSNGKTHQKATDLRGHWPTWNWTTARNSMKGFSFVMERWRNFGTVSNWWRTENWFGTVTVSVRLDELNVLIQFTNTSRELPWTVCRESQNHHSRHSNHNPCEIDNKFILHTTTQFVYKPSCLIIACAIRFPSAQSSSS